MNFLLNEMPNNLHIFCPNCVVGSNYYFFQHSLKPDSFTNTLRHNPEFNFCIIPCHNMLFLTFQVIPYKCTILDFLSVSYPAQSE